jgi:Arc/MetJ family transcription regulator
MSHTCSDLDGQACALVMSHFKLPSEPAAVNSALRQRSLVHPPSLRASGYGSGLEG